MEPPANAGHPKRKRIALACIAIALLLYTALTLRAAFTLSPTYDEPLHAASAWNMRFANDCRLNDEDPALWQQVVSLFLRPSDLPRGLSDTEWQATNGGVKQADDYFRATIPYQPKGLILHARLASITIALALGVSLAYIAWKLSGPVAATAVTLAFSLEPLLLAHGPLVKNDIAVALCFLWSAYLARNALNPSTKLTDLFPLAFVLAISPLVKFSGLLLWPATALVLLLTAYRDGLKKHLPRLATLTIATALTFLTFTWLAYGLRFPPGPKGETFDTQALLALAKSNDLRARTPDLDPENPPATAAAPPDYQLPLPVRAAAWIEEKKFLPQPFCTGFIYTYASSLYRRSFLLDEQYALGTPLYFPIAYLTKTPLTLIALTLTGAALALHKRRFPLWLLLPPALYLAFSLTTRLNIGLRHLMPIYPFLLLGIGLLIAHLWPRRRFIPLLALPLLAAESLPFTNHHLSYFNLPSASLSRNGLLLLGDSNLDWGQDTYLLAAWQKQNPNTTLYTYLFTPPLDPKSAGLNAIDLTTTPQPQGPGGAGIFAISATRLQGIYATGQRSKVMHQWRNAKPDQVLGNGTIHLFSVPNTPTLGAMR